MPRSAARVGGWLLAATAAMPAMLAYGAQGDPRLEQAIALEHGEGVPKDLARAATLYCEAAADGNADALFNLGWMYANGRGVPRDDAIAATLITRAAQAGSADAARVAAKITSEAPSVPDCLMPPPAPAAPPVDTQAFLEPPSPPPFEEADLGTLSPGKQKIVEYVKQLAPRFAVEPGLALAVIAAESNFEPSARSPKDAQGLMQLIPETAARFNVRNPLDPQQNIRGGLAYLRWLLAYYRGEVSLAVAAYNAGEKAVDRYRGIPPYPETREYVQRVRSIFRSSRHAFDPKVVEPSPVVTGVQPARAGAARKP